MRGLLRTIGGLLLLCALVWFVVILYWQVQDIRPSGRDLALYLGALPVGGYVTLALLRKSIRRAGERASRQSGPAAQAEVTTPEQPEPARQAMPLEVLASGMCIAAGQGADELVAAALSEPAPGLHPGLKDASGFPVFASAVASVEEESARAWLEACGAPHDVTHALLPEQLRALSLLQGVAQDLLVAAAERQSAGQGAGEGDPTGKPLQVEALALVPPGWQVALREALASALQAEAIACGLHASSVSFSCEVALGGADVLARLQHLATAGSNPEQACLVMACSSLLGARSIASLDSGGQLLSARNPEGLVPGEGAAGLLLRPLDGPAPASINESVWLQGLAVDRQGVSWKTRAALHQATGLVDRALEAAGVEKDAVAMLLTDADVRGSRRSLASGLASCEFPQLEPDAACANLGLCSGYLAIVSPLLLAATAAQQAATAGGPVLALYLADAHERAAWVAMRPPAGADAAASDSA